MGIISSLVYLRIIISISLRINTRNDNLMVCVRFLEFGISFDKHLLNKQYIKP